MTTPPISARSYNDAFDHGVRLLNSGDHATSLLAFAKAATLTKVTRHLADVSHQRGLVFTKMARFAEAEGAFNQAIYLAYRMNNLSQVYRIKRDLAWVEMVRFQRTPLSMLVSLLTWGLRWLPPFGTLGKAHALLLASIRGLEQLGEEQEALISESYLARLEVLRLHYKHATKMFQQNYDKLLKQPKPNPTYVLNLLMWLIRAVPRGKRGVVANVIGIYIPMTGQTSREVEVKVIRRFGDIGYRIIQWIPPRIQEIGYKRAKPLLGK